MSAETGPLSPEAIEAEMESIYRELYPDNPEYFTDFIERSREVGIVDMRQLNLLRDKLKHSRMPKEDPFERSTRLLYDPESAQVIIYQSRKLRDEADSCELPSKK